MPHIAPRRQAATIALIAAVLMAWSTVAVAQEPPSSSTSLQGTAWRLTTYRRGGAERQVGPEVAAWMRLSAGAVEGSGGCRRLKGRYATQGDSIGVELADQGDGGCAEQTSLVENALRRGLRRSTSFRLLPGSEADDPELVLIDPDGVTLLRFELDDIGSLTGGEWRLVAYGTSDERVAAAAGQPAVLTFVPDRSQAVRRQSDGSAVGSSGCNGIVADYFQHASVLSFGELSLTDAPCSETLQAQQDAMAAVLDATSLRLELPPDRLILVSDDTGEWLEFESASPLESTTWLLTRIRGGAEVDDDVTLRLDAGRLAGEGPCGPYSGGYATDGVSLSFRDLDPGDLEGCDAADSHRALLAALRGTVMVERSSPGLRFLDVFGRSVLRFRHPGGP